jgi:ribulose-phosphate 3-epimerase
LLEIVPSLASANQSCLKEEIEKLGEDVVKSIHLDIEDGNFIPNITFGLKTVRDLRKVTQIPFSIHLMVNNPDRYIAEIKKIGINSVAVHIEACKYPLEIINLARDCNIKIGFALNPKTTLDELRYILDKLDFILIMTSEPDYRGQNFIYQTLDKVKELNKIKDRHFEIWVDGGIKEELLYDIYKSGADVTVMGRSIFNSEKPREQLVRLKNLIANFK